MKFYAWVIRCLFGQPWNIIWILFKYVEQVIILNNVVDT